MSEDFKRVAVIGAGVAGITAAHLIQRIANVKLFEKNDRLGGHTHTVVLEDCPDAGVGVDTGFIVLNDKTYPLLHKLLAELNCTVRDSEMSFGFSSVPANLYYAGTSLSGMFAQRRNMFRPGFYAFIREILRFGKQAIADLDRNAVGDQTLGAYTRHLSPRTIRNYIVPMAAAIWSATQRDIMNFPARMLLQFWRNHGLLAFNDRPQWQTVVGGSHAYVKAFKRSFCGQIALRADIQTVRRDADGITIIHRDGYEEAFDHVIFAAHADESLSLLEHPSDEEQELLGAWRYQKNRTLLHTDTSFMPKNRKAWASWNYMDPVVDAGDRPVPVTYHMNRLQGLNTSDDYFVTLNPDHEPKAGSLIKDITYHHPIFTPEAVATQSGLPDLNGKNNTWFCGSYFSYGFHEDAVRSGVQVAKDFGAEFSI